MKQIFVLSIFLLLILSKNIISDNNSITVTSYSANLSLSENISKLNVSIREDVGVLDHSENQFQFILNNYNIPINITTSLTGSNNLSVNYINNDTFYIEIPPEKMLGNNFFINFEYVLDIDTTFQSTYMLFDWYPRHFNDLARWDISYVIPKRYNILCEGNRTWDSSITGFLKAHYESNLKLNRFYPMVLINNNYYKNYHLNIDDIALDYYFISNDTGVINSIIHCTTESFKYYRNLIGEYSFDNLKFVEMPGSNYGNSRTTILLMGSELITNYNKGWNEWPAHEVAHQWAGAGFYGNPDDNNLWCIFEPMAEYLRLMYIENSFGKDSLNNSLAKIENEYKTKVVGTEKDIPLNQGGPTRALYLKGPLIFHKIRNIIGNENWINFLKYIYTEFKGKYFTFSDFKQSLFKFNADDNTLNLLDKWISQTGMPE